MSNDTGITGDLHDARVVIGGANPGVWLDEQRITCRNVGVHHDVVTGETVLVLEVPVASLNKER